MDEHPFNARYAVAFSRNDRGISTPCQKSAAYDPVTGAIQAYHDDEDFPAPPGTTTIPITDAEWQACLLSQSMQGLPERSMDQCTWGKPEMDELERKLRQVLSESDVPVEDQSSILHMLASDIDAEATETCNR